MNTQSIFESIKDDYINLITQKINTDGFCVLYTSDLINLIPISATTLSFLNQDNLPLLVTDRPRLVVNNSGLLRLKRNIMMFGYAKALGRDDWCDTILADYEEALSAEASIVDLCKNVSISKLNGMLIDYAKKSGFRYEYDLVPLLRKKKFLDFLRFS